MQLIFTLLFSLKLQITKCNAKQKKSKTNIALRLILKKTIKHKRLK